MRTLVWTGLLVIAFARAQGAEPARAVAKIRWQELPATASKMQALVQTHSGANLKLEVLSVSADSASVRIQKTSDSKAYPKGERTIERKAIASVVLEKRRVRGRVIGTVAGFYVPLAIAAVATGSSEVAQGWPGLVALGGAVLGYYAGKSTDIKRVTVEFID
jgi:hypothetical protein